MDFTVIDFETANRHRSSACEIGITIVENFEIVAAKSWLFKPANDFFEGINISIHGINHLDVEDKSYLPDYWDEIKSYLHGKLVFAHNASFDMSVLRFTLDHFALPYPEFKYACSCVLAKKLWEGLPSYSLSDLCALHKTIVPMHRAKVDSIATAELIIKMFKEKGIDRIEKISRFNFRLGEMYSKGYKGFTKLSTQYPSDFNKSDYPADKQAINNETVFYGKTVAFTGTLNAFNREQSFAIITFLGGIVSNGVTKKTDYLIVGQPDLTITGNAGVSTKLFTAIKYKKEGQKIEILQESEFMKLIDLSVLDLEL